MREHRTRAGGDRGTPAQEGASAVEFALVLPLLIVLIFGIVVFGVSFHRMQGMQATAREAARLAAVGASVTQVESRAAVAGTPTIEGADLQVVVERLDAGDNATPMAAGSGQVACDETVPAAEKVRVTVSVADPSAYAFNIPLYGPIESSYSSEAVFRCE